ncbi:MAG: hypothetical protein IT371_30605 [Deltaproteobacteria bacterium]|nr:hypothetical protein [Deltaproteobacteria bacterium]
MAQGIQLVPLPSQGTVAGRPRKESVYDTDVYLAATAMPQQILLFNNFAAFSVAPALGPKQFGRDTNLRGTGTGGLPQATHLFWYSWRLKCRSLGTNLNQPANAVVPEQMNRWRELGYAQFAFQTSVLITTQLDELPSGAGPQSIFTTVTNTTMPSLPSGIPSKREGKDVTIMGRPVELNALEAFNVPVFVPQGGFAPQVDLYITAVLDGVLLRGLSA